MADETVQPDLYAIPEEEFFKLMEQAKTTPVEGEQTPDAGQPRDEQGRFAKVEDNEPQEVDEVVYRREIELGDGSGKQVFEGSSYDELLDKLATAQENATRKIRELNAAAKKPEVKPVETDENEDWLLSQELMTSPSKVIRKQIEKELGKSLTEIKTELEEAAALRKEKSEERNAASFLESHPEFVANKHNGRLMENYIRLNGLTGTTENIEKAFEVLSEGGLLQLKTDDTEQNADDPTKQRIAAPAGTRTVVIQKKAASGVSAKSSTSTPGPLTEQDLYEMPMDKFLELGGMSKAHNW